MIFILLILVAVIIVKCFVESDEVYYNLMAVFFVLLLIGLISQLCLSREYLPAAQENTEDMIVISVDTDENNYVFTLQDEEGNLHMVRRSNLDEITSGSRNSVTVHHKDFSLWQTIAFLAVDYTYITTGEVSNEIFS